jgi:phosphonate transport system permease protein
MGRFVSAFWPPAHDAIPQLLLKPPCRPWPSPPPAWPWRCCWRPGQPAGQPRAVAVGGVRAAPERLGAPAALAGARLLIFLRSVPEIVWALLFVRAVGLGPTAGVLAIAITYSGMLGKVYAEIFESVDQRPAHALLQAGSGRLAAFAYGILPNVAAELLSYTVYRWECAMRASVVMGFVGAGGLGQQIDLSMRMFAGGEVASMLLTFLLLVLRRPTQPPAALEAGMNRLINLALLLGIGAAVVASFATWAGPRRTGQQRRAEADGRLRAALPQPGPERRAPASDRPWRAGNPGHVRPGHPARGGVRHAAGAARRRALRLAVAKALRACCSMPCVRFRNWCGRR